jgi:hypothetical protein
MEVSHEPTSLVLGAQHVLGNMVACSTQHQCPALKQLGAARPHSQYHQKCSNVSETTMMRRRISAVNARVKLRSVNTPPPQQHGHQHIYLLNNVHQASVAKSQLHPLPADRWNPPSLHAAVNWSLSWKVQHLQPCCSSTHPARKVLHCVPHGHSVWGPNRQAQHSCQR